MPVDKRQVEEQLSALGDFHRFFTSKEIRYLPQVLVEGEVIHGITSGFYESKTWIIVITNMRLVFLDKGMLFGLKQVDMPLSQIDSISHKTGLLFGEIKVATASGAKTIGSITKRDVVKIASIIAGLVHGGGTLPQASPSESQAADLYATRKDLASQLERLAALREKGVLTEEEFQVSKARILEI